MSTIKAQKSEIQSVNLFKKLDEKSNYRIIEEPKILISKSISSEIIKQGLSVRQFAEKAGMKHPQIHRITSGKNYNIDTLLKILNSLDLEITITKKI